MKILEKLQKPWVLKAFLFNEIFTLSTLFDLACTENARAEGKSLTPLKDPFPLPDPLASGNTCVSMSVECECATDMGGGQVGFTSIYQVLSILFFICSLS